MTEDKFYTFSYGTKLDSFDNFYSNNAIFRICLHIVVILKLYKRAC